MNPLESVPTVVVFDVNVLVSAAASGNSPFRSWPSPPPVSGNPSADCLGVVVDAAEFALWLSPHILTNVDRVLAELFKWAQPEIDAYLTAVVAGIRHAASTTSLSNKGTRNSMECAMLNTSESRNSWSCRYRCISR